MNKIVAEKIPVAFLSLDPINNAIQIVQNLRGQGANVTTLITLDSAPPPDVRIDFEIVHISRVSKLQPRPEYVLVSEDVGRNPTSRLAIKLFSNSKVINISRDGSEGIYQIFMNNIKELYSVYESLIDEESKKTFCGYWLGAISNCLGDLVHSNDMHYLTAGFIPEKGAIVIDGGAYDGATGALFAGMGYKVYSFEMDNKNFEVAKKVAEEKNFVIENMGLGAYKQEIKYNPSGSASSVNFNGTEKAKITTIDAYVRENNLPRVDFIKLDVEGSELNTLKGAKTSISRYKPILAISAYHKWEDFWTLMNFIKSIRPDYEFAMRHYASYAGEEAPAAFGNELVDYFNFLDIEPVFKNWWECCILAR